MKFVKNNLTILCGINELIKLDVNAHQTQHLVNSELTGVKSPLITGEQVQFRVDHPSVQGRLIMRFNFSEPHGGIYEIKISGEKGGVHKYTVKQGGGTPYHQITFSLEGDHTTQFPVK